MLTLNPGNYPAFIAKRWNAGGRLKNGKVIEDILLEGPSGISSYI